MMKLMELAERTGARVERSAGIEIKGAAGLDIAEAGDVTFLANKSYTQQVESTRASAIFVGEDAEISRKDITVLRTRDPYLAYTRALILFHPEPEVEPFIHPSAVIDPSARLSEDVWIGPNVVVGRDVEIGARVRIYPNATIYDGVRIGAGSVIHSGVSLREGAVLGERVRI